jgi:hypothetical protein
MMSPRPSWRNPKILAILMLVFLCGATAGALTMRLGRSYAGKPPAEKSYEQVSLQRMKRELALTPEQTAKLEMVLDDYGKYYQDLLDQLNSVRANGKQNVLRVLNDDQKLKFEKMMKETVQKSSH